MKNTLAIFEASEPVTFCNQLNIGQIHNPNFNVTEFSDIKTRVHDHWSFS